MFDFDPVTTASSLAASSIQPMQESLKARSNAAQNTSKALNSLKSALSAFESTLSSLSGSNGLRQYSATLGSDIGTASATSRAMPGVYSFHVEQLAKAHQIAFEDLPAVPVASGGPLVIQLEDGSSFQVDLIAADSNNDGSISQEEIARAINQTAGNGGKVTASIATVGAKTTLLLSAGQTGADSQITLDTSALPAGALRTALEGGRELVAAQDAIVWLGGQGGIELRQASNTFNAIQGVSITFTRAMDPADAPVTLTVAADDGATADNVKKFVDAYNTLKSELDKLTKPGGESGAPGPFASDAGVRTLRSRLNQIIREEYDGLSLMQLGVRAERDGSLSLDSKRLNDRLSADPEALEKVFGSARLTQRSGMLGGLSEYVEQWVKSGTGQIASRQSSVEAIQKRLTERQSRLDQLYDTYYMRYLQQFSELQSLQAQMNQTLSLFSSVPTS